MIQPSPITPSTTVLKPDLISATRPENMMGCGECDAVFEKINLSRGERAYCLCCGAEIGQAPQPLMHVLALVLTALIVFIIANCFPIVKVEVQANSAQTTLLGAAWMMFDTGRAFVGVLILFTTFIVPLLNLLLMIYILVGVSVLQRRPTYLRAALRGLYLFRTWGMIEVFLIGVLVTLVKLVSMVVVIPGVALWAFAILSLLMVYLTSIKLTTLWDEVDRGML